MSGPKMGRVGEGDRSWLLELPEAWLEVGHHSAVASSHFLSWGVGGEGGCILPGKEARASETVNDSSRGGQARASGGGAGRSPGPPRGPAWLTKGKLRPAPAGPGRDLQPESRGLQHLTLTAAPYLLDREVTPFHPQSQHNATAFMLLFKASACSSWLHSMQGKTRNGLHSETKEAESGCGRKETDGIHSPSEPPRSSHRWGAWSPGSQHGNGSARHLCQARPQPGL